MADFQSRYFSVPDGLKLHARDYSASGDVSGVPVLCLHGLTRNAADFEGVAPRIAALGRRVIVPDMRGRGKSERDLQPARYTPLTYCDDVLHMLKVLEIPRAVFIGTSMGGIITMIMAKHAPSRIVGAVLNDIGPELDVAGLNRIAGHVRKAQPFANWAGMIDNVRAVQGSAFPDANDAFFEDFARRVAEELPDGRVAYAYDTAIAEAFSQIADGPQASLMSLFQVLAAKPLLLVRGELSDLLTPDAVERMQAIQPAMRVVQVPRIGHAPMLDEPDAWAALQNFLRDMD